VSVVQALLSLQALLSVQPWGGASIPASPFGASGVTAASSG
jgi:hypothetical protein